MELTFNRFLMFVGTPFPELWPMLHRQLMKTLIVLNRKALYFPALPVVNTLCAIRAVSYIAIVRIAKRNEIAGTDEQDMLARRRLKGKTKNKNRPR